jgi:hypothetical protein
VKHCTGWILEHRYTPASLSRYEFLALKGADRVVASSLVLAGELIKQDDTSFAWTVHAVQAHRDDYDVAHDEAHESNLQGAPGLVLPETSHVAGLQGAPELKSGGGAGAEVWRGRLSWCLAGAPELMSGGGAGAEVWRGRLS